jgi:glycosidase
VNLNYRDGINVREQAQNPYSLLNYYKHLINVRRQSPALTCGDYKPIHTTARDYFAFLRFTKEQKALIILNFTDKRLELDLTDVKEIKSHTLHPLFSSADHSQKTLELPALAINPFEVFIAEVKTVND